REALQTEARSGSLASLILQLLDLARQTPRFLRLPFPAIWSSRPCKTARPRSPARRAGMYTTGKNLHARRVGCSALCSSWFGIRIAALRGNATAPRAEVPPPPTRRRVFARPEAHAVIRQAVLKRSRDLASGQSGELVHDNDGRHRPPTFHARSLRFVCHLA